MIDLSGRVALITGSARGIGRGCALEMAKAGADIAVNYHTQLEAAEEVAAAVRTMGRKAVVIGADVAVRDQVDAMVAETVEHLGRLDIAVCNAARSHRAPFLDLTVEQFGTVRIFLIIFAIIIAVIITIVITFVIITSSLIPQVSLQLDERQKSLSAAELEMNALTRCQHF